LCARAWGRGLATEAGRAVARFAFDDLGATALFAGHHPDNGASRKVLLKLGFVHTHDELYPPTGLLHPSYRLERERPDARPSR
jgi:RimJ/RimL family protein N-acetyltransferase